MTKTNKHLYDWIDNATYSDLLNKWRHIPIEDCEYFQGEVGNYFAKILGEKKAALSPSQQVQVSKSIGW